MDISAALAADLHDLTEALESPGDNLTERLKALTVDFQLAVRSHLGLSMTFVVDGYPATFGVFANHADTAEVATSLLVPLDSFSGAEPGSSLIFYATVKGAFIDFAADLAYLLGLELDQMILDRHLTTAPPESTLNGLSTINQAIGILIDRGHSPEQAPAELRRYARHTNQSVLRVASDVRQTAAYTRSAVTTTFCR